MLASFLVFYLIFSAQVVKGANIRSEQKNEKPVSTVVQEKKGLKQKSSTAEKIARIEGRLRELSRGQRDIMRETANTAQIAIGAAQRQMEAVFWLLTTLIVLLTGGGIAGGIYFLKSMRKWNKQIEKQEGELTRMRSTHVAQYWLMDGSMTCELATTVSDPKDQRRFLDQAINSFREGLEAKSGDSLLEAKILAWNAWVQKRLGLFNEAVFSIRKARKLAPNVTSYTFNEACYVKLFGNLDEGYRLLDNAISSDLYYAQKAWNDDDWKDQRNEERFKRLTNQ